MFPDHKGSLAACLKARWKVSRSWQPGDWFYLLVEEMAPGPEAQVCLCWKTWLPDGF